MDVSEILLIDSTANYFKHRHEWPHGWNEDESKGVQLNTIKTVKRIGMSEGDLTDNMEIAMHSLGLNGDLSKICDKVEIWRGSLSAQFSLDPEISGCLF